MMKILVVLLVSLFLISPALALEGARSFEVATEDHLSHLPYSWTTDITSKSRINGVYVNVQYMDATPFYFNVYLDSNKGATYDMLLATEYRGGIASGVITYIWEPIDLIIEKADNIRLTIGSDTNAPPYKSVDNLSATPFSALIKGVRQ